MESKYPLTEQEKKVIYATYLRRNPTGKLPSWIIAKRHEIATKIEGLKGKYVFKDLDCDYCGRKGFHQGYIFKGLGIALCMGCRKN